MMADNNSQDSNGHREMGMETEARAEMEAEIRASLSEAFDIFEKESIEISNDLQENDVNDGNEFAGAAADVVSNVNENNMGIDDQEIVEGIRKSLTQAFDDYENSDDPQNEDMFDPFEEPENGNVSGCGMNVNMDESEHGSVHATSLKEEAGTQQQEYRLNLKSDVIPQETDTALRNNSSEVSNVDIGIDDDVLGKFEAQEDILLEHDNVKQDEYSYAVGEIKLEDKNKSTAFKKADKGTGDADEVVELEDECNDAVGDDKDVLGTCDGATDIDDDDFGSFRQGSGQQGFYESKDMNERHGAVTETVTKDVNKKDEDRRDMNTETLVTSLSLLDMTSKEKELCVSGLNQNEHEHIVSSETAEETNGNFPEMENVNISSKFQADIVSDHDQIIKISGNKEIEKHIKDEEDYSGFANDANHVVGKNFVNFEASETEDGNVSKNDEVHTVAGHAQVSDDFIEEKGDPKIENPTYEEDAFDVLKGNDRDEENNVGLKGTEEIKEGVPDVFNENVSSENQCELSSAYNVSPKALEQTQDHYEKVGKAMKEKNYDSGNNDDEGTNEESENPNIVKDAQVQIISKIGEGIKDESKPAKELNDTVEGGNSVQEDDEDDFGDFNGAADDDFGNFEVAKNEIDSHGKANSDTDVNVINTDASSSKFNNEDNNEDEFGDFNGAGDDDFGNFAGAGEVDANESEFDAFGDFAGEDEADVGFGDFSQHDFENDKKQNLIEMLSLSEESINQAFKTFHRSGEAQEKIEVDVSINFDFNATLNKSYFGPSVCKKCKTFVRFLSRFCLICGEKVSLSDTLQNNSLREKAIRESIDKYAEYDRCTVEHIGISNKDIKKQIEPFMIMMPSPPNLSNEGKDDDMYRQEIHTAPLPLPAQSQPGLVELQTPMKPNDGGLTMLKNRGATTSSFNVFETPDNNATLQENEEDDDFGSFKKADTVTHVQENNRQIQPEKLQPIPFRDFSEAAVGEVEVIQQSQSDKAPTEPDSFNDDLFAGSVQNGTDQAQSGGDLADDLFSFDDNNNKEGSKSASSDLLSMTLMGFGISENTSDDSKVKVSPKSRAVAAILSKAKEKEMGKLSEGGRDLLKRILNKSSSSTTSIQQGSSEFGTGRILPDLTFMQADTLVMPKLSMQMPPQASSESNDPFSNLMG